MHHDPGGAPRHREAGSRDVPHDQTGSLTYEPHFGLREKPFSLSADPRFLYKSRSHSLAFSELAAAIRRREGLVVLTGEIGTGKTTLCRAVLESLDRRTFSAFVADPFLSREDLLKTLLVEFGVVSMADVNAGRLHGATRQDLSYRLYDFLNSLVLLQALAVVVVDEAQNLSLPLLEELRILADLEWHGRLIQVVLVGQPELRNRLKLPQLRQVDQRVSMRCELTALGRSDLAAYVDHRLSVARGSASILGFAPGAFDVVHHASAGVPRLINVICDRALHEAHGLGVTRRIEAAVVWKAIEALGLGVTPAAMPIEHGTSVIDLKPFEIPEPGAVQFEPPVAITSEDTAVRIGPAAPVDSPRAVGAPALPPLARSAAETETMSLFRSEADAQDARTAPRTAADPARRGGRRAAAAVVMAAVAGSLVGTAAYFGDVRRLVGGEPLPGLPTPPIVLNTSVSGRARAADVPAAPYVLEVALFDSAGPANGLVQQLAGSGYPAYTADVTLGRGRYVQVLAGGFESQAAAERALEAIRGIPGYSEARFRSVD